MISNTIVIFMCSVLVMVEKVYTSSMSDAMSYACSNANTPEKARKVIECGTPPREVYQFLQSCNDAMKVNGITAYHSSVFDERDPEKKLHIMCHMPVTGSLYSPVTPQDTQLPSQCIPNDEIYRQIKLHYWRTSSRRGRNEFTQCLYSAMA